MMPDAPRSTSITIPVNEYEKRVFETMAQVYDSSQAAVTRMYAVNDFKRYFGTIHPDALDRHDVDADALVRGEADPASVDDRYKVDTPGVPSIPAADGGALASVSPSSYSTTYTKQDISTAGPEMTWDELKETIGSYWDDGDTGGEDEPEREPLTIHPDRVRKSGDVQIPDSGEYNDDEYALLSNHDTVAKILVGLLRNNDVVSEKLIEAKILQYTEHQIERSDTEAGRKYKKETYKPLVTEYFIEHPDPLEDKYYTSEVAMERAFPKEVEETISSLVDQSAWLLDPREYAQRKSISPKKDASQWVEDLAEFRRGLGFLYGVTTDKEWGEKLKEYPSPTEEWPNAKVAAGKIYNEMLGHYANTNQWARFAAANAVLEISDGDVLVDEMATDDGWKEINADRPSQPHFQWVESREKPMSPQMQLEAVREKI